MNTPIYEQLTQELRCHPRGTSLSIEFDVPLFDYWEAYLRGTLPTYTRLLVDNGDSYLVGPNFSILL